MLERQIEDYLKREVKKRNGECIKLFGVVGIPDRMVILPKEKIGFIELKRPGERPRQVQYWWIRRLRNLGFLAGWSDTKESVDKFLELLESEGFYNVSVSEEGGRKNM